MKDTPPVKPRRQWLRWGAIVLLACLIATGGLAWWLWRERVMVANLVLDRLLPEIVIEVKELEIKNAAIEMKNVRAWWRADGMEIASIKEARWHPHWEHLRGGMLGAVKLGGATVTADLERFRAMSRGGPSGPARWWTLDEVELEETPVTLKDERGVLFSAKLTSRIESIVIGGTAPEVRLLDLRARDVAWRDKPALANVKLAARSHADGIEVLSLHAADGAMDVGVFFSKATDTIKAGEAPALLKTTSAWPRQVFIHDARLQNLRVTATDLRGLTGALRFSWEGHAISWESGAPLKLGAHTFDLTELALRPARGAGGITAEALHVEAEGLDDVQRVDLRAPQVRWTQALEDALLTEGGASESKQNLKIGSVVIQKGDLAFEATQRVPVSGSLKWSAQLQQLEMDASGLKSPRSQKVVLSEIQTSWASLEPFLTAKAVSAEVTPDALRERYWIDSVSVEEPRISLTPENGPWFEKIAMDAEAVMTAVPIWKRLGFGKVTMHAASTHVVVPLAERVTLDANWEVLPSEHGRHGLHVIRAQAVIPARPGVPVASLREVFLETRLPDIWQERRLELIRVGGGHVDVGEPLMSLFATPAAGVAEQKAKAVAERWVARMIDVRGISVTLEEIAPKFPPVNFSVEFAAQETPLDLEGLAENIEPKQVMLRNLRIPSPYRPLNTVAEMDVILVTYTLDGLLHRRIDRVEIVKPLLFVGEDMFWYVDNYRKFIQGEAEVPDAFVGPVQPPKPKPKGWFVDTLSVSGGQLVVAPKGTPIEGLGEPFPFNLDTRLESGELNAELIIPNENREIAKVKLRFTGLRGKVQFNLPMKERSNNVVEVFQADRMQWKNLHAQNTNLSVTYDRNGIYGNFYAKAYEGDINGAFNIYMDDAYTWDGWVALTKVRSGPITRALFPEYFVIDGIISGKVIATGDSDELYQGDAEFRNDGRGRFEVSALNKAIKDLPPPRRGDLSEQIQRIGLETLRDFDYDTVDGKARFYGREGTGHLRFAGPVGKRTIEIRVFDHQWKGGTIKNAE